jgi:hypothetical protein
MRRILFFGIIIGLIVSCVETKSTEDEFVRVNCLVKDNVPFLVKDSLEIFDTVKIKLETGFRIIDSYKDSLSFIAISSYGDAIFNYVGLFDRFGKPIINIVDTTHDWNTQIMPNPEYFAHSNDNEYYLLEGGTSASVRTIQIFNKQGNEVDKIMVVASLSRNGYSWNENNELIFFVTESYKGGMTLAEEVIWKDGKLTKTGEKQEVYME